MAWEFGFITSSFLKVYKYAFQKKLKFISEVHFSCWPCVSGNKQYVIDKLLFSFPAEIICVSVLGTFAKGMKLMSIVWRLENIINYQDFQILTKQYIYDITIRYNCQVYFPSFFFFSPHMSAKKEGIERFFLKKHIQYTLMWQKTIIRR